MCIMHSRPSEGRSKKKKIRKPESRPPTINIEFQKCDRPERKNDATSQYKRGSGYHPIDARRKGKQFFFVVAARRRDGLWRNGCLGCILWPGNKELTPNSWKTLKTVRTMRGGRGRGRKSWRWPEERAVFQMRDIFSGQWVNLGPNMCLPKMYGSIVSLLLHLLPTRLWTGIAKAIGISRT